MLCNLRHSCAFNQVEKYYERRSHFKICKFNMIIYISMTNSVILQTMTFNKQPSSIQTQKFVIRLLIDKTQTNM